MKDGDRSRHTCKLIMSNQVIVIMFKTVIWDQSGECLIFFKDLCGIFCDIFAFAICLWECYFCHAFTMWMHSVIEWTDLTQLCSFWASCISHLATLIHLVIEWDNRPYPALFMLASCISHLDTLIYSVIAWDNRPCPAFFMLGFPRPYPALLILGFLYSPPGHIDIFSYSMRQ